MQKRVTIRDVADKVGVNHSTASRALSGYRYVSEKTRARVLSAAEEMGYRPDPGMRSLARHRWANEEQNDTARLAYIFWGGRPNKDEPHYLGASKAAERLGYALHDFYRSDYPSDSALQRILYTRGYTGLLLRVSGADYRLPDFRWSDFSVVNVGMLPNREKMADTVNSDIFSLHFDAAQKIIEGGKRRPGLVLHTPRFLAEENLRIGGLKAGMSALGVSDDLPIFWLRSHGLDVERPALWRWVDEHQIDVIMGQSDFPYRCLMANEQSLRKDLGFVHLGMSSKEANHMGVVHDLEGVGAAATSLLAMKVEQNIRGIPDKPAVTLISGRWQGVTRSAGHTDV